MVDRHPGCVVGADWGRVLRLVAANASHSAALATALSEHVWTSSLLTPVKNAAAVQFAQVLYQALGAGRSLRSNFQLATSVAGCEKYCLRGRKDANKFVSCKPEVWTMCVLNVTALTGGYQGMVHPMKKMTIVHACVSILCLLCALQCLLVMA